jgi:hypothetical protein
MTFDSDLQFGLIDGQREYGIDALWTRADGSHQTLRGVFNGQSQATDVQDAGIIPGYDATLVCERSQFVGRPAVRDLVLIDGDNYRIITLVKESVSYELRLRKAAP